MCERLQYTQAKEGLRYLFTATTVQFFTYHELLFVFWVQCAFFLSLGFDYWNYLRFDLVDRVLDSVLACFFFLSIRWFGVYLRMSFFQKKKEGILCFILKSCQQVDSLKEMRSFFLKKKKICKRRKT